LFAQDYPPVSCYPGNFCMEKDCILSVPYSFTNFPISMSHISIETEVKRVWKNRMVHAQPSFPPLICWLDSTCWSGEPEPNYQQGTRRGSPADESGAQIKQILPFLRPSLLPAWVRVSGPHSRTAIQSRLLLTEELRRHKHQARRGQAAKRGRWQKPAAPLGPRTRILQ